MATSCCQVPMFRMRVNHGMLSCAVTVFLIGGLASLYFFAEDAYCTGASRGSLTLAMTLCLTSLLMIGATGRFWFKHLWHHRSGYRYG